ncbi:glycosyltransferase family 4 protein [Calothrix sp. UHCC 0171]|uniref:glycosyltransferase family 4 protein n=1 Tax=Calothrix sp. UHCC 0171 TaxID=3110245 RepID=UPI002B20E51D|nr:glycosyltransferase family 4 protein [Calothrix sp. UHCC 0171]MEA5571602.1 glycosyltransferase family 4 protein [Calothrix sp. UHCC 0171]
MKFCIVTPYVIKGDGQGRANYEIVWEAIRRGHQMTLVARKVAPELEEHPLVRWVHFDVEKYPTALIKEMVFSSQSDGWLQKHRHEFDLVQVYGAVTSAPGDVNTSQFVHTSWQQSPVHTARIHKNIYGIYHWAYSALNAHWEKQAFQQAKVAVAVSDKIKQELIDDLGIEDSRIQVIHNGVDIEEFTPGNSNRTELGLPEGVNLALFAGDIRTNRKNLDTVLHALVKVSDLHLVVVGNTEGSPYPAMAATLGLSDRVHFLGFRRDMSKIMQAVDMFVFPSRYEACTLVLLEAMASGLPAITATSAGGAELVTPECGFVLENSDDVEGLATALKTLAGDRQLRTRMGQASRAVAERNTWVSKAQLYMDLFEGMVNDKHHRNNTDLSPSTRPSTVLGSA